MIPGPPPAQPEKWIVRKDYTRIRQIWDIPQDNDVRRLASEMKEFFTEYKKNGGPGDFWHRKSQKVVLAVLHLRRDGKDVFVRGINTEVSLPTGTICAERAAIVSARAQFAAIARGDMKGIAVLDAPFNPTENFDPAELANPLPPCGACREWLEKIQEESKQFYVLTFPDLEFRQVHERFLFWSVDEKQTQPDELGPWTCRQCKHVNAPMTSECEHCRVDRYSLQYTRAPNQTRFLEVMRVLRDGPLTKKQITKALKNKDTPETRDKVLKTLQIGKPDGSRPPLVQVEQDRYRLTAFGHEVSARL